MIAERRVAKDKKTKPPEPAAEVPEDESDDAAEYTEHVLVPLPFKERLERIAQRVNQDRRRRKLPRRSLGWFVVRHLEDWMATEEASQAGGPS